MLSQHHRVLDDVRPIVLVDHAAITPPFELGLEHRLDDRSRALDVERADAQEDFAPPRPLPPSPSPPTSERLRRRRRHARSATASSWSAVMSLKTSLSSRATKVP